MGLPISQPQLAVILVCCLTIAVVGTASNRKTRGAIYARFSSRFQHSIEDQIRTCRKWADDNGITVLDHHIFTDKAKSGRTNNRAGHRGLLDALKADEVDVVITFATNRLHRKIYKALQFVEEKIVDKRKRCVFVAQGIDTSNTEFWRALLTVFAMLDEIQVQMLSGQVRAGHEGLARASRKWGTTTFGYTGKIVEGRKTRRGRSPEVWIIDEKTSQWVKRIFSWFVDEERSIEWITTELNRQKAPLPPKAKGSQWTTKGVRIALSNTRYIGDWSYGKSETKWMNEAGYPRQFERDKPLVPLIEEGLRILRDEVFFRAEALLEKENRGGGRKKGDQPDILYVSSRLLVCPKHEGQILQVRNTNGIMQCPRCKTDPEPALVSTATRHVVDRLLVRRIAELIRSDSTNLVEQALVAATAIIGNAAQPNDEHLAHLDRRRAELTRSIQFILANPGDTDADVQENTKALANQRAERAGIEQEIVSIKALRKAPTAVPKLEDVRWVCNDLATAFEQAVGSTDRGVIARIRRIVQLITGGKIVVSQQGERKAKLGWLRGTFKVALLKPVLEKLNLPHTQCDDGVEVSVDFRDPTPAEEIADEAKALYDTGLLEKEIAAELSNHHGRNIGRNLVMLALDHWFGSRGEEKPDGRARRAALGKLSMNPAVFDDPAVVKTVMEMYTTTPCSTTSRSRSTSTEAPLRKSCASGTRPTRCR